ncbi:MAG: leucine-rich repeat protein [Bacteroidales bacterium]|jgi:hypothetical protein
MKKLLLVLILCSFGFGVRAHDFSVMNSDGKLIYYNICSTSSPYSAMVTYKGNGPLDYTGEYSGVINIPSTVIFNSITYSVDSIIRSAFDYCPSLTSVNISNSVKTVGAYAFNNCQNLISVSLPNSITTIDDGTFAWCPSLTSINIPNTVTSIGMSAFYGDSNLTSIILPSSLNYIESYAFNSCAGLTSIIIPNLVTSIGSYIFGNCPNLSSITLSNSLDSIPDYTFSQCSSLTSIIIPNTITYLGSGAFANCTNLVSVSLPNSINSINNNTFYWCTLLDSVIIPNSVRSIGDYAFNNCTSMKYIEMTNSINDIGAYAFENCNRLRSLILPNNITIIKNNSFRSCTSLTTLTIPNAVTSIGSSAFGNCNGLTSVYIPNSVTSIGADAFNSCFNIHSIIIPSSVSSIGASAFAYCWWMDTIINLSLIPQVINANTFHDLDSNTILYVPCGYASVYQAASNWNVFDIQANQPITKNINAIICPNQTYTQNGFNVDSAGIYNRSLTSVGGCDSIIYLILRIRTQDTTRIDASICLGQVYNYNGFNANATGEYYQTIQSSIGCDSILVLTLLVFQPDTTRIIASVCPGQGYTQNGFFTGTAGVHTLHLFNQNGCDSTVVLYLSLYNTDTTYIYANICQGESYNFFNMNYYMAGTYSITTYSSHWCDSTVVLYLSVNPKYNYIYNQQICQGQVYTQHGFNEDSTGTYVQNLQTIKGCDSILTLNLSVYQNKDTMLIDTICEGSQYTLNGFHADTTGTYILNRQTIHGCDSIITLNLFVKQRSSSSFNAIDCNSFAWNNTNYYTSGDYQQIFTNSIGCDSIVTLHLTITPKPITPEICMVTVDENKHNVVVWKKEQEVVKYDVYREGTQSGQYDLMTSIPYDSVSMWVDTMSNSSTRSYRYRITSSDTCNHISDPSTIHKTLHLTINQGINNSWNLIWTPYEGINYSSLNIYKGNANSIDSLFLLTTISGNNTTYTDVDNQGGTLYYQIEILLDNPCDFTKSISSIRSNIVSSSEIGLSDIEYQSIITLYPNPTKDKTILSVEGLKNDAQVMVYDIFGRMIKSYSLKINQKEIEIDVSGLASGTYYVICKDTVNALFTTKKLIVY